MTRMFKAPANQTSNQPSPETSEVREKFEALKAAHEKLTQSAQQAAKAIEESRKAVKSIQPFSLT